MSDNTLLEHKIDNLTLDVGKIAGRFEGQTGECKGQFGEIEDRLDGHASSIDRIIKWALEGNGDSAEKRLKAMEVDAAAIKICVEKAIAPDHIAHIAEAAATAVVTNAKGRDRTTVAKLRAIGPLLAGCAAILTAVITLVAIFAR